MVKMVALAVAVLVMARQLQAVRQLP